MRITFLGGADQVDMILVTHAHTDYTGALELVVARVSHCAVYATVPTVSLTRVLPTDARRITTSRLDEEGELPLYGDVAVQKLLAAMIAVPFRAWSPVPRRWETLWMSKWISTLGRGTASSSKRAPGLSAPRPQEKSSQRSRSLAFASRAISRRSRWTRASGKKRSSRYDDGDAQALGWERITAIVED